MQEYGFSLTRTLPYKENIVDFVLIRENTGQWKPVFSCILCGVMNYRVIKEYTFLLNDMTNKYLNKIRIWSF